VFYKLFRFVIRKRKTAITKRTFFHPEIVDTVAKALTFKDDI
jgi:hypothetical protein